MAVPTDGAQPTNSNSGSSERPALDSSESMPDVQKLDIQSNIPAASDGPSIPSESVSVSSQNDLPASQNIPSASSHNVGATRSMGLPQDMQAKMRAFHLSRQGAPPSAPRGPALATPDALSKSPIVGSTSPAGAATPQSPALKAPFAAGLRLPPSVRPQPTNWTSAPAVQRNPPPKPSLGARRGLKLPGGLPGAQSTASVLPSDKQASNPGDEKSKSEERGSGSDANKDSLFNKFSDFVDTKTGTLKFAGKAVIHGKGIDFSGGSSFSISLDEVDNLEELGKGNYGTVYRVRHSRPRIRRPGLGLKGSKVASSANNPSDSEQTSSDAKTTDKPNLEDSTNPVPQTTSASSSTQGGTTGIVMAMKEIRLELDEAKFTAIIMELDILHRCISPFIVDFYGAFFQEGAVYICMEYMDGGSIDKLYGDGIPEPVLRKVTLSTVMGLKSLKEDHNIIHRDVKPTNILANTRGQIKICDFGVSGNLVASIAKTNIGCQSYMAPERISGGGMAQSGASGMGGTYSVQSDIWSLALSVIECAMGRYPYPPETFNNIFSQLSAIVDGDPPGLPKDRYSEQAQDFVKRCLNKKPDLRPTYSTLLRHPWLAELLRPPENRPVETQPEHDVPDTADEEVAAWVTSSLDRKRKGGLGKKQQPALHAAPLDAAVSNSRAE